MVGNPEMDMAKSVEWNSCCKTIKHALLGGTRFKNRRYEEKVVDLIEGGWGK